MSDKSSVPAHHLDQGNEGLLGSGEAFTPGNGDILPQDLRGQDALMRLKHFVKDGAADARVQASGNEDVAVKDNSHTSLRSVF